MSTFAAYLFVGLVWMSNGSVQPPVARIEATREECLADILQFSTAVEAVNTGGTPTMRMSYHAECLPVMNDSEAKRT